MSKKESKIEAPKNDDIREVGYYINEEQLKDFINRCVKNQWTVLEITKIDYRFKIYIRYKPS